METLGSTGDEAPEKPKREQYEEIRGQMFQLKGLIEHPGWKLLVGTLNEQADTRRNKLLQPASGIKRLLEQELEKGELMGICLVCSLPEALIEQHEAALEQLKDEGALSDTGSEQ